MGKSAAVLVRLLAGLLCFSFTFESPAGTKLLGAGARNVSSRVSAQGPTSDWYMAGANPQRTSWVSEEVRGDYDSGTLRVQWYRPIEAYIPQNVQIIAANGLLYISTAKGLYALNAATGAVVWRYDTELPLSNSPTVVDGVAYVGGYDHQIHALDALSGQHLWSFDQAQAGFDTNPLVVDGRVFVGNRDGWMYAVGAHGTPRQGQLLWKFETGGPIHFSAAFRDGVVYFAADDNYAYALRADDGQLVWKSSKLLGDGFHSWWPVVWQDKVVFPGALGYKVNWDPGTNSVKDPIDNNAYLSFSQMDGESVFFDHKVSGDPFGPVVQLNESWAQGKTVRDASRITEYFENNPDSGSYLHKPWRRSLFVLNSADGGEYTFDSDNDGHQEYAPFTFYGTHSGNRHPPVVGGDSLLYETSIYSYLPYIPQGMVEGWKAGTRYLTIEGGQGAVDEPKALSSGGNVIYRCSSGERTCDWFTINQPKAAGQLWSYFSTDLAHQIPGYVQNWTFTGVDDGMYFSNYGTINGIYGIHGDQNPVIPYRGRLYIHKCNTVIAYGPPLPGGPVGLPLLEANQVSTSMSTPTLGQLEQRLADQVQKIISAGPLRTGYYMDGNFHQINQILSLYFNNPGETLYTLSVAYPHLSAGLQQQTRDYLRIQFQSYFSPTAYSQIGWAEGAAREAMPMPPEVSQAFARFPKTEWPGMNGGAFRYPQHNFYALYKYVQLVAPHDESTIAQSYNLAKSKLEVPPIVDSTFFTKYPWQQNRIVAGYIGFLELQELANKTSKDAGLRTKVTAELNRQLSSSANRFSKDTYWIFGVSPDMPMVAHERVLNVSRNFITLVPELGTYLSQNAQTKVREALAEYNFNAPYWFVSRYEAVITEGAAQNLYDYPAMFQAKAFILKEPREQLTKYLDVPAFDRGDLFYIQNLVAAIEAGPQVPLSPEAFAPIIVMNYSADAQ